MGDKDVLTEQKSPKVPGEAEDTEVKLETGDDNASSSKDSPKQPASSSLTKQVDEPAANNLGVNKYSESAECEAANLSKEFASTEASHLPLENTTDCEDVAEPVVDKTELVEQESGLVAQDYQPCLGDERRENEGLDLESGSSVNNVYLPVQTNQEVTTDEVKDSETSDDVLHKSQGAESLHLDTKDTDLVVKKRESSDQEGDKPRQEKTSRLDESPSLYHLKKFRWKGELIQIVTQNENGPCPLLAIANVLVLSKRITLPLMQECITATQLMEYIGDYILTVEPKNVDETVLLNYQQNMHDAISIMYKLQTGIDVNVKFTGPCDFELTPECLVFDILNIGLYHGWLVDPQDFQVMHAIGNLSYNQLVEKIIQSKEANSSEGTLTEGLTIENFLEQTASQLTYHGLCELNSATKEGELCVFFRNNHFNTLYKFKDELFLLVTDQGYLTESKIIWETLANVDGDGQFVDENFVTVGPMRYQPTITEDTKEAPSNLTQEDRDYLIALSLQEENQRPAEGQPLPVTMQDQEAKDLELARHLQEEENRIARERQMQQNYQQGQQLQQRHQPPPLHNQGQRPREIQGNETQDRGEKCVLL